MNKEELIAAMRATAATPPVKVEVEGWGTLYVRPPTVAEVDVARTQQEVDDGLQLARGACRVICDEHGARVFDPTNKEEVELLNSQPFDLVKRVLEKVKTERTDEKGN